jgi:VIT1/CCC1 family predicted Fe2+/Mn2+ transporter
MVLNNLAVALEVEKAVVEEAIAATAEIITEANRLAEAEREAAWRQSCSTLSIEFQG